MELVEAIVVIVMVSCTACVLGASAGLYVSKQVSKLKNKGVK
jgi:hypothetical protein